MHFLGCVVLSPADATAVLSIAMSRVGATGRVRHLIGESCRDVTREVDEVVARRRGGPIPVRRAVAVGLGLATWGNALVLASRVGGRHGELMTLVGQVVAVPIVVGSCLRNGLDARSLGLTLDPLRRRFTGSARFMLVFSGAAVVLGVGAVVLFGARCRTAPALPVTRLLVATSLGEEVLFRGVLFAVWAATGRSAATVTLANAGFFGLWHVAASVHGGRFDLAGVLWPVVGTLLLFAWSRARFGSVAAPAVVHASGNLPAWVLMTCR